jgi:hypothetical protein
MRNRHRQHLTVFEKLPFSGFNQILISVVLVWEKPGITGNEHHQAKNEWVNAQIRKQRHKGQDAYG